MAGRAFTVRYVPAGAGGGTVGDYLDDCRPGDVAVLDNDGRLNCTVWGDILTSYARQRGLVGTVINGVCRDVAHATQLAYPIFSRGRFMRTGKDRVIVAEVGGVVTLGDVQVRAGDIVIGDDDGVVVVPAEHAEVVCRTGEGIAQAEDAIVADLANGVSLADARRSHGYHDLQKRETADATH